MSTEYTYVYIVGPKNPDNATFLKIGISNDLDKRVKSLSKIMSIELDVKHAFRLDHSRRAYKVEQLAHSSLASKSLGGECFSVTKEEAMEAILKAIDAFAHLPDSSMGVSKVLKGKSTSFRFSPGMRKTMIEAAEHKGLTVTDYLEQLIRKDAKKKNFEMFKTDDPAQDE